MNYLYLVLSNDFGLSACTTVHATMQGALDAIAALGYGGLYVQEYRWDGDVTPGMYVRLGGVSTPYDDDYTTAYVRADSDGARGDLVEVKP